MPNIFSLQASHYFKTISDVSQLFQLDPAELLDVHHESYNASYKAKFNMQEDLDGPMTRARAKQLQWTLTNQIGIIEAASELKISNQFEIDSRVFQATFNNKVPENSTIDLSDIACRIFEGLAKPGTLVEENTSEGNNVEVGTRLLIPRSPPPSSGFLPTILVQKTSNKKLRNLYIAGSVVGFILLLAALVVCGLYVKALRKFKVAKLQSFNTRSSPLYCPTPGSPRSGQLTGRSSASSCLSPDLLAGIKYSLRNYSIEDLKRATDDFSEERKIGDQAYKGLNMDNAEMMRFEQTRQVIDIRSKINHINILNLLGVCYGENDYSWSYLVFELPSNGCLRDSRNIFVTTDWRAKLTNIRTNPAVRSFRGNENIESVKGCVAPEYVVDGSVSEKCLALRSKLRKDDVDGKSFKECIAFLGEKTTEGGCFDGLRSFMDPCLKEDYPLAEALRLAVLAKACVEPSMDDILKVLVRMVR
ncbi:hypothetical protein NC651_021650 [Populus alba x Populus x berolinensis]|nr:hypothetical protein NC651_021650 [Populus alba x Populus x berolinensis]